MATAQAQTSTVTTLATFNNTNGARPYGDVTLSGSTLYGTTSGGGANSYGTVFSVNIVPEPGTWAALTLGAGVLGVTLRDRRPRRA